MTGITSIIKRDGREEAFDVDKLFKWVEWASVVNADWKGILLQTTKSFKGAVKSSDLHEALIRACLERKDEAHSKMAGRLQAGSVFKRCYGGFDHVPTLSEYYHDLIYLGYIPDMGYDEEELEYFDSLIDHEIDLDMNHSQIMQIVFKYSLKNRTTGQLFETPRFSAMRMALGLCRYESKEKRKVDVAEFYDKLGVEMSVNAPTPNWNNLGTFNNGYASCCLHTPSDDLGSLAAHRTIDYLMTAASAGLGNMLMTRSVGDPVRGGVIAHGGKLPYLKDVMYGAKANKQGSRGGAVTTTVCCLDPEIVDLLKARSIKTVDSKKVDGIDYNFSTNKSFLRAVDKDEDWMLISNYHAPDLWEAFFDEDCVRFDKLYSKYASDPEVAKSFVKARSVMALEHCQQMQETGRQYNTDITEVNRHTPFKDTIHHGNLCVEIFEPTVPYSNVANLYDPDVDDGEIALCNLSAIIPSRLDLVWELGVGFDQDSVERYTKSCYYALKMIDNTIEIMDYPFPNLKKTAQARRNAGVGITGLAYELARRNLKYSSQEGAEYMHDLAELHYWGLLNASLKLAEERGNAEWMHKTKWPDGWLPIDTYNKNMDTVVEHRTRFDWEGLREKIITNGGHRFSVLCAHMPTESSSVAADVPNSLYPVRELVVYKVDDDAPKLFVTKGADTIGHQYELAYDIEPKVMSSRYGIFQKWCDMGISCDFWVNRTNFDKATPKFSADYMLDNYLAHKWYGNKSTYYTNTKNGGGQHQEQDNSCTGGACTI
mgnify:CR=1 FL=1